MRKHTACRGTCKEAGPGQFYLSFPGIAVSHPIEVVVQGQFEHGGAVDIPGEGKVLEPTEEDLCAAESNHMEHNRLIVL